jgi:hypothetical protein
MRSFIAIAMAAALGACATMPADQQATVMNTVYIAGDRSAPIQPVALPAQQPANPAQTNDSSLRRLYWYLSGR